MHGLQGEVRANAGAATRGAGGASCPRPFQWRWVAVDDVGGRRFLFDDLIDRCWLESDENGRVRPTSMFPAAVATGLTVFDEPD